MKEKPIIFSTDMVKAILEGRKTQTRRIIKLNEFGKSDIEGYDWQFRDKRELWNDVTTELFLSKFCPYQIGQTLWVRETFSEIIFPGGEAFFPRLKIYYKADGHKNLKWKSPYHMKRMYARLFLQITNIRVERLQDISDEDAIAEGVYGAVKTDENCTAPDELFKRLWDSLNAKRGYPWNSNPYVWVLKFIQVN